jgi:hypothetical protein
MWMRCVSWKKVANRKSLKVSQVYTFWITSHIVSSAGFGYFVVMSCIEVWVCHNVIRLRYDRYVLVLLCTQNLSLFDTIKFRIMKQLGICSLHSLSSSSCHRMDAIRHSFIEMTIRHSIRTCITHASLHCSWNLCCYLIWLSTGLWCSWEYAIRVHCGVWATVASTPFRTHFSNRWTTQHT